MLPKVAAYGISFSIIVLLNLLFNLAFGEYGQALWFISFIALSGLIRLGMGISKKRKAARNLGLSQTQHSGS